MICEKVYLWEKQKECYLQTYISEESAAIGLPPRKAMVICPGGGYEFLSPREAEPIAKKFLAEGMNVFVLHYSLYPNAGEFVPLIELSLAIAHIREHCEEYHVDPEYVFVTGFSAGGHLAASAATLWNCKEVRQELGIDAGLRSEGFNRPTGTVLCYPVITGGKYAHDPSICHVCGDVDVTADKRTRFSLEKQVDANTSPTFIWHTFTDQLVPVQNTLLYIQALTEHGVPFEAHIYPYGPHGLSLGIEETAGSASNRLNDHISSWFALAMKWINDFDKGIRKK